jgi:hypothetical protein
MDSSPSAFLAYGYDLCGEPWKIAELGDYDLIDAEKVTWYDDGEYAEGFIAQAEKRLLAEIAGFTETWETRTGDGFVQRQFEAKERAGVSFQRYGYREDPKWVLAAKVINVGVVTAKAVEPAELATHPDRPKWDAALFDAVKTLGITPVQETPSWLLCAYYG